jgi:superfamily II DNA or RNA helicase
VRKHTTLNVGNVWSELVFHSHARDNIGAALSKSLTIEAPGAAFTWAYKSGEWDGKVSLFKNGQLSSGTCSFLFRSGLVPRVLDALKVGGISVTYGHDARYLGTTKLVGTQVPLRNYQYEAVRGMFGSTIDGFGWWPRGVCEVATGGGKTEISVAVYEMNPEPTFFLVHRKDLLLQAQERFLKYGHRVGMVGAGRFTPHSTGINIATMQTLMSVIDKYPGSEKHEILTSLLQDARQVFFDECHLMASNVDKGNEFTRVADMFERARFRWGLTATPFMRAAYDNLLLEGITGKSLYQISSRMLIDQGYLTTPKVIMKKVPGSMALTMDWKKGRSNKAKAAYWRAVEDKGIKFNEPRTRLIVDEIRKGPYPMLILVKTIDQANFIKTMLKAKGFDVPFLSGKDSAQSRRAAVESLRDASIPAIMATTIFDEGVDIPELRKVILASGGKSQVKLLQRVGRGLRIAAGKHEVEIIDFMDGHHSMLAKHAQARRKVWKEQDFDVTTES